VLASILTACAYQPLSLPPVCVNFTESYWAEFNFGVVAPGPHDQMVPSVYNVGNGARGNAGIACLSKPWPGSFEALDFVSRFGLQQG